MWKCNLYVYCECEYGVREVLCDCNAGWKAFKIGKCRGKGIR